MDSAGKKSQRRASGIVWWAPEATPPLASVLGLTMTPKFQFLKAAVMISFALEEMTTFVISRVPLGGLRKLE
jgi:hypothetical protein